MAASPKPKAKRKPRAKAKPTHKARAAFHKDWKGELCSRISGGRSLRSVCKDDDIPSTATVMKELAEDVDGSFPEQYARACELRAEVMFEDILSIADDGSNDKRTEDGQTIVDHDVIARSRLRVDARKWMLGKMQPKKYGTKVDLSGSLKLDGLDELIGEIHGGEGD